MDLRLSLYALSCSYLLLAGFLLILPLFFKTKDDFDVVKQQILANSFPVIMGIIGLTITTLQLIIPLKPIPVLGDIMPAIITAFVALTLIFSYVRFSKYLTNRMIQKSDAILTRLQIPIGFAGIVTCLIHLLFGTLLFL